MVDSRKVGYSTRRVKGSTRHGAQYLRPYRRITEKVDEIRLFALFSCQKGMSPFPFSIPDGIQ